MKPNNKISNSGLDLFDSCPRAYYFRYEEGLEKVNKTVSDSLTYGSMFHEYLENRHNGKQTKLFETNESDPNKQLVVMLNEQIAVYEATRPQEACEFIMVEQPFSGKFIDPKTGKKTAFTINGIIDALVKIGDEYWLWENKTTSRADNAYIERIAIDRQTHIYKKQIEMLFSKKLNGQPIMGVMYNIIQKPSVKWNEGETDEEFALREKEATRPKSLKRKVPDTIETYAERVRNHIKPEHFILIKKYFEYSKVEESMLDIADIFKNIKSCRRASYWRKCTKSCHKYNSECEFFKLCLADNNDYVREEMYQKRTQKTIIQPVEEIF